MPRTKTAPYEIRGLNKAPEVDRSEVGYLQSVAEGTPEKRKELHAALLHENVIHLPNQIKPVSYVIPGLGSSISSNKNAEGSSSQVFESPVGTDALDDEALSQGADANSPVSELPDTSSSSILNSDDDSPEEPSPIIYDENYPRHYDGLSSDSEEDEEMVDAGETLEGLVEREIEVEAKGKGKRVVSDGTAPSDTVPSDTETRSTLTTIVVDSPYRPGNSLHKLDADLAVKALASRAAKSKPSATTISRPTRAAKKNDYGSDASMNTESTRPVRIKKPTARLGDSSISSDRPTGVTKNQKKPKKAVFEEEDDGVMFPNLDFGVKPPTSPKRKLKLVVTPHGSPCAKQRPEPRTSLGPQAPPKVLNASPSRQQTLPSLERHRLKITGFTGSTSQRKVEVTRSPVDPPTTVDSTASSDSIIFDNPPPEKKHPLKNPPVGKQVAKPTVTPTGSPGKKKYTLKLNLSPSKTSPAKPSPKKKLSGGRPATPSNPACLRCKQKHKGCDKTRPICGRCEQEGGDCEYPADKMDLDEA